MSEEKKWITDRRPEEPGIYWVTLEYEDPEDDGVIRREVDFRYYAEPYEDDAWIMSGEEPAEYHWTKEIGSDADERVIAWMPIENIKVYKGDLKEGVEYVFDD